MTPSTHTNPTIDVTVARPALLELHRRLLQAQRIQVERYGGRMNAGEVLQAATQDARFSWLTQLSKLIAELDQARFDADHDAAQTALSETRALMMAPDPETEFGRRYLEILQAHPEVVFAHRDATVALSAPTP